MHLMSEGYLLNEKFSTLNPSSRIANRIRLHHTTFVPSLQVTR